MSNTLYDVQTTNINISSNGNTTIVASNANQFLYLIGAMLIVAGATTLTFEDTNSNTIAGPFVFSGASTLTIQDVTSIHRAIGMVKPGAGLVINSSNSVQISGYVRWSNA
jgi:hypothetical protein